MRSKQYASTLRLCAVAMMAAMAYAVMLLVKIPLIPAAPYLTYEPKDVFLTLIALLIDLPLGVLATVVVAFVEMLTIGQMGVWGFVMNVASSCAFLLPVALLCRRKQTPARRAVGGVCSVLLMAAVMIPLNYLITPLYTGMPRAAVLPLLCPAILPFNLIKGGINAVLVFLLFVPARAAFTAAKLTPAIGEK